MRRILLFVRRHCACATLASRQGGGFRGCRRPRAPLVIGRDREAEVLCKFAYGLPGDAMERMPWLETVKFIYVLQFNRYPMGCPQMKWNECRGSRL